MHCSSKFLRVLILIGALAIFNSPVYAVDPPPDGGYANENTAEGEDALFSLSTGVNNTAVGFHALYSNTTASFNTAVGAEALSANTTGSANTAIGDQALAVNSSGAANTAVGYLALSRNVYSVGNIAIGGGALAQNTEGDLNTAVGAAALGLNTSGSYDTAVGDYALYMNVSGNYNAAVGYQALYSNTVGYGNTAAGYSALYNNTTGFQNTANGRDALALNTSGNNNTAYGYHSLSNNGTGSGNIALGYNAGNNLNGNLNIDIGNSGVSGESNTIRIGRRGQQTATFVAGISGTTVASGVGVVIDSNGQLGTITSSARYKEKVLPMAKSSEAILALKPVTFRYKLELDPRGISQFGLVAEDVAKVDPDLVAYDDAGKPYSVRYEAVNAMLLNEFLKEHRRVEEQANRLAVQESKARDQDATIRELKSAVATLTAMLKAQAAQLQKVSDEVRMQNASAGAVALNH